VFSLLIILCSNENRWSFGVVINKKHKFSTFLESLGLFLNELTRLLFISQLETMSVGGLYMADTYILG
jgi:hypothetical protein